MDRSPDSEHQFPFAKSARQEDLRSGENSGCPKGAAVTVIDDYLKKVEPSKKKALERIRALAKECVPSAEETISYGMPTLTYKGKPFLGFDAHKNHIGIYPFSGHIIETFKAELREYRTTKGAIQVPLDNPIPKVTLRKVINARLKAIRADAKT
jgi:uncharacterized protein YdhG (YjbR/CyaY superfamily)